MVVPRVLFDMLVLMFFCWKCWCGFCLVCWCCFLFGMLVIFYLVCWCCFLFGMLVLVLFLFGMSVLLFCLVCWRFFVGYVGTDFVWYVGVVFVWCVGVVSQSDFLVYVGDEAYPSRLLFGMLGVCLCLIIYLCW